MYPQTTFQLCNWIFGKKILQSWNLILPPLEYRTVPAENIKMHQRPFQLKLGIFAVQIWKQAPNWDEHTNTHKSINDYEKYTLKLRTGIIKVQIVFPREGIPCHVKFGRVLYLIVFLLHWVSQFPSPSQVGGYILTSHPQCFGCDQTNTWPHSQNFQICFQTKLCKSQY